MYELRVRSTFAAAHRLHNYPDKCQRLHGHTWEVEIVVASPELNDAGMLVDFSVLKRELREVTAVFDHCLLNDLPPFNRGGPENNPTAENLARLIFDALSPRLAKYRPPVKLTGVTVWESPVAAAAYRGPQP